MSKSLLDRPIYPAAEAGRLVGLSSVRVRRWLKGYKYKYEEEMHYQNPIIRRQGTLGTSYASFLDLIDLLFVKHFVDHGISLQKVRCALDETAKILGTNHFARQCFFRSGKDIYLRVKDEGDAILELLSGGQWVIAPIIEQLATHIDFDVFTDLACRWFPKEFDKIIVLDPLVSFGYPAIVDRGITTLNAYDFYIAENKSIKRLCSWMNITPQEAQAAVDFQKFLAA